MNIVISIFLILLIFIYINYKVIFVSKYKIYDKKIPSAFNGYKILQISDFHSKEFRQGNEYLIKKIDQEKPDIIVMTGDMINSDSDNFSIFTDLAKKLATKYEVYYIFGNHEMNLSQTKKDELINIMKNKKLLETTVKLIYMD